MSENTKPGVLTPQEIHDFGLIAMQSGWPNEEFARAIEAAVLEKVGISRISEDRIYDLLSELSSIDTHDINLRDHPAAYALVEAAERAVIAPQPAGYIHPDNVRRLASGVTVAFRKRPYEGEREIPVYLDAPTVSEIDVAYAQGRADGWQAANSSTEYVTAQGGIDYLGLALDLESSARKVESQTAVRAMEAAAWGLRMSLKKQLG